MTHLEWQQLESTISRMTAEEKERLLSLVRTSLSMEVPSLTPETLEAELARVSFEAPPLPADFARADIYLDHD